MPVESLGRSMWTIEPSPELLWADRASNAVLAGVRPEAPAEEPQPRRRSGWPRLALLLGVSLLLGVLLTVAIAWVRGLDTVPVAGESTSFEVTWQDRSGGKAVFVIVEVVGTGGVPLAQAGAGKTSVVVDGIEPGRPYCLAVLAVTETSQGISPLKCTGVRSTRPAR
jgi:hypothetical protein